MNKKAENSKPEVGDRFYAVLEEGSGVMGVFGGVAALRTQCRSRCIQGGKACPLYKTCKQKYELREILP